jgi:hypothetical protein
VVCLCACTQHAPHAARPRCCVVSSCQLSFLINLQYAVITPPRPGAPLSVPRPDGNFATTRRHTHTFDTTLTTDDSRHDRRDETRENHESRAWSRAGPRTADAGRTDSETRHTRAQRTVLYRGNSGFAPWAVAHAHGATLHAKFRGRRRDDATLRTLPGPRHTRTRATRTALKRGRETDRQTDNGERCRVPRSAHSIRPPAWRYETAQRPVRKHCPR